MEDKDLDAILTMDGEDDMGPLGIYNNSISPIHGQLTKRYTSRPCRQAPPSNIKHNIASGGDFDNKSQGSYHSSPVFADSVHSHSNANPSTPTHKKGKEHELSKKVNSLVSSEAMVTGSMKENATLIAHMYTLTQQLVGAEEELGKVKADLMLATTEKNKLQKKLNDALLKLDHAGTNCDVSLPVKKEIKDVIEAQSKSILWSRVKFIQSPEEEMMAAKMLIGYAQKKLPQEQLKSKASRKALATTYKVIMRRAIFQKRNYVAAEHKKVMMKQYEEKGAMPTVDQLVKCLQRKIKTEDEKVIFQFYWEKLLPKQVGSLMWSKDVRNYNTICEATRRDVPKHPMITPEDEAFTVLVIENSYDRWEKEIEEKNAGGSSSNNNNKKKKPNYNGKYTTTDSGQNEWGGWTDEGLQVFKKYVDMNRLARVEKETMSVERECLHTLKTKYNIVCNDPKAQCDLNKSNKRKRKRGEEELQDQQKKKPMITIHEDFHPQSSDDESDEDDDDDEDEDVPRKFW